MSNLSPSVTDGVESIPVSDRLYCVGYLSPSVTFHAPILCLCDDYVCACPRSHSSPSLTFSCWTTDNPGLTLTFVPPSPPPPPLTAPTLLETTTPIPGFYLCVQTMKTPWKQILTSGPFWAIVVAHCTYTWVTSWMMSYLPKYLSDILKFGVEEVRHILRQLCRSISIFSGNFCLEYIDTLSVSGLHVKIRPKMLRYTYNTVFGLAEFAAYCGCVE